MRLKTDYFTENRSAQPKTVIADYVESEGLLVPQRFNTFKKALNFIKKGGSIIIRSEHPQEYDGVSGLLDSFTVNKEIITKYQKNYQENVERLATESDRGSSKRRVSMEIVIADIFKFKGDSFRKRVSEIYSSRMKYYCELLNLDLQENVNSISFSYWEKIDGYNRTVIADSSIKDKYHIFTNHNDSFSQNYLIIENGEILLDEPVKLSDEMKNQISDLIGFYESVRTLKRFNLNHCPIIEIQTDESGFNYFLQYHRCNDFRKPGFILDREVEDGEFEAFFVRGCTAPEGIVLDVTYAHHEFVMTNSSISKQKDGSFNMYHNDMFSEIMSRRRTVDILPKGLTGVFTRPIDHLQKTAMFKASISIICNQDELRRIKEKHGEKLFLRAYKNEKDFTVPVRIISDGRKAYLKIL